MRRRGFQLNAGFGAAWGCVILRCISCSLFLAGNIRSFAAHNQERANYDEFSAKGLEVTHKAFGSGIVIAHNGNLLNIRFGEQVKRFQMPQGFSKGFLKTDSTEIMDMFNEIAVLDDKVTKLKSSQSAARHQLETLK